MKSSFYTPPTITVKNMLQAITTVLQASLHVKRVTRVPAKF
jgi:hypothetical protein